jgi:hypothetical protein
VLLGAIGECNMEDEALAIGNAASKSRLPDYEWSGGDNAKRPWIHIRGANRDVLRVNQAR